MAQMSFSPLPEYDGCDRHHKATQQNDQGNNGLMEFKKTKTEKKGIKNCIKMKNLYMCQQFIQNVNTTAIYVLLLSNPIKKLIQAPRATTMLNECQFWNSVIIDVRNKFILALKHLTF